MKGLTENSADYIYLRFLRIFLFTLVENCNFCGYVTIEIITEYTITLCKTLTFYIEYPNIWAILFLSVSLPSGQG